jgi:hypothetical protein
MRRISRTALLRVAVVPIVVALLAACGGSADEMSNGARTRLAPLVSQVRARAISFDPNGTQRALVAVRDAVLTLRRQHAIGKDRAAAILAAVAGIEARISMVPTTTTTTTTAPPARDDHAKKEPKKK